MLSRSRIVAGLLFAIALACAGWWYYRPPVVPKRTYTIGWREGAPFQTRGPNGEPSGLALELIRTAADRAGITLKWVYFPSPSNSEAVLRTGTTDLWPLITITPERLKAFHITDPYVHNEYAMIVRADSRFRTVEDLAHATIGYSNSVIDLKHLHGRLPEAGVILGPSAASIVGFVCAGKADAAFVDGISGIAALLNKDTCPDKNLRWIAVPEIKSFLGLGSTFASQAAADAIRREMGTLAQEGQLSTIFGRWSYMATTQLESMQAISDARRRETILWFLAAIFAILFALACWQTVRVTRERDRTRRAESALRQAEAKLRLMANSLREMVLAYDMDGRLIFVNAAVTALTGYSPEELKAAGFINWVHPDDQERMKAIWKRLFEGGECHDEEYRLITKDGTVKWTSATWGPMLDSDGRQAGVQGTEHDITEHRALQERYLQAQKLESVGRLAGGVAHDFNNLLTIINGYSEIMLQDISQVDPLRPQLEQVRNAGRRAADVTQQLLAFSRKQIIEPHPLDLSAVVAESREMFERLVGEDVAFQVNLREVVPVIADPGQIHQVLMNLLANARDSMPHGGRLMIETADVEITEDFALEHSDAVAGPAVMLAVRDTGSGMTEEVKEHLFEPFFTTKERGSGTGLGLATVYGIVRQNQGWILVESQPGEGTTFRVYFPQCAGCEKTAAREEPSRALPATGKERVLIVEDEAGVRKLASEILETQGYCVLHAANAADALRIAQDGSPIDLLITDVVLPDINGKQLADRLKALHPETKVLFTSGYTWDIIASRGVLESGVAYIPKPYTPGLLSAKAREILDAEVVG